MEDLRFGVLVRMTRLRLGLTQEELASRAGTSRWTVSRVEHGRLDDVPMRTVRAIGAPLGLRVEVLPRARAADLDRALNSRHAALAEHVIRWIRGLPGWTARPEVSFAEYGERGVIDLLAWHEATRCLLVIELKTEVIDVGEVLGTLDRKRRLGPPVAARFGWRTASVSVALLIGDSMSNRRRVGDHAATLRAALPHDGRALRRWLATPSGELGALRFVPDVRPGHVRSGFAGRTRVSRRGRASAPDRPRSAQGG